MPILDELSEVRVAPVIAGDFNCWRCGDPPDHDGFCGACGAVTIPTDASKVSDRSPTRATSSTAAIRRAVQLETEPDPFLNALDPAVLGGGLELRGSFEA